MGINNSIDIADIVGRIEAIMKEYAPIEAMWVDIFTNIDVDIPMESNIEAWKMWIYENHMNYSDFICNVLIAVLSEICADTSLKVKKSYVADMTKKVYLRQKKIAQTKQNVYGNALFEGEHQPYFEKISLKALPGFFRTEFDLVWDEVIDPSDEVIDSSKKRINPLLKLAASQNINLEHFSYEDLQNIINYYKNICTYLNSQDIFCQEIILYHLEIETRLSSILQILKKICNEILNDRQKEILYRTRGISRILVTGQQNQSVTYQNSIYFGRKYYIEKSADCCLSQDVNEMEKLTSNIYNIVRPIYTIRDTLMDNLRQEYEENYNCVINNTFNALTDRMNMDTNELSNYEIKLLNETNQLKNEYNGFNSYDVKLDHFIRMYISDDKLEEFKQAEIQKKECKKKKRQERNKTKK